MERHGNLGKQRVARVLDEERSEFFFGGYFTFRTPATCLEPARKPGNGRNDRDIDSRALREMRGTLVYKDSERGIDRIREERGEGQDSQFAGSIHVNKILS